MLTDLDVFDDDVDLFYMMMILTVMVLMLVLIVMMLILLMLVTMLTIMLVATMKVNSQTSTENMIQHASFSLTNKQRKFLGRFPYL